MSLLRPETRCKRLARDIRPLATHHERFRPSVRRISIRREDWDLLREHAEAARAEGFTVNGPHVSFQGFELAPTHLGEPAG